MKAQRLWIRAILLCIFGMVLLGGITRLTQSGLSIVDWKPIMGALPPMTEAEWNVAFARYREFPQFRIQFPQMNLSEFKWIFFWEYTHRLLGRLIGVIVIIPGLILWLKKKLPAPLALRVLGGFALGGLQGVLGWYMVKSGLVLEPRVSHLRLAAHLMLALLIFVTFAWIYFDLDRLMGLPRETQLAPRAAQTLVPLFSARRLLFLFGGTLLIQITYGAFVAGLRAGLGYNTFPLMDGQLIPSDFWLLSPDWINFLENRSTVQWVHRQVGLLLCILAGFHYLKLRKLRADHPVVTKAAARLFGWVLLQYSLGAITILTKVSIPIAVIHQGTAVVLLFFTTQLFYLTCGLCSPSVLPPNKPRSTSPKAGTA
jgi:cytochrome c oxidase assembly protein subunit 15